jgi:hypothetical protein
VERLWPVSASSADGDSEVGVESPASDHVDTAAALSDDEGIGGRVVEVTAGVAVGVDRTDTAGALDATFEDEDETLGDETGPDGADAATGLLEVNGSEEPKSKAPVKMPTTRATAMEEAMPRAARE